MSKLKFCQGPKCHSYYTKDRLKGMKGNKTYQTRRRSNLLYGEFCDTRCYSAWLNKYATRAIDHFGRLKKVKHLTEQNAWDKRRRWNYERNNGETEYYYLNKITDEQRPLTESQYDDNNYTLNERQKC